MHILFWLPILVAWVFGIVMIKEVHQFIDTFLLELVFPLTFHFIEEVGIRYCICKSFTLLLGTLQNLDCLFFNDRTKQFAKKVEY